MKKEERSEKEQIVEKIDEKALIEHITEEVEESNFDYSDVTDEERERLLEIKMRKGTIIYSFLLTVGKDLSEAQKIYSKNGNGKFSKWVEEEYGIARTTAFNYIKAYEVWNNCSLEGTIDITKIENLGIKKMVALSKLSEEQQKEVIENTPLEDFNVKQVEELTKRIKELESSKNEPRIVEVIPNEIKQELEELRAENKILVDDNEDKADFIMQQNEELIEQRIALENLKIENKVYETEQTNIIDIGVLLMYIKDFLKGASSYTLLKGQYENIPPKTKKTLFNAINQVKDWCMLMEQAIKSDFRNVGNNIIIENEEDIGGEN